MILLCPPEKSTQFHYPLDPKKIRAEGSMHKDTTYQGSDRQDFYQHGKKKKTKKKKTNKLNADLDWVCHRQPSNYFCWRQRAGITGIAGPKRFRDFRETGPWTPRVKRDHNSTTQLARLRSHIRHLFFSVDFSVTQFNYQPCL